VVRYRVRVAACAASLVPYGGVLTASSLMMSRAFSWWNRVISKPFEQRDSTALHKLKTILYPLMLRRTKSMRVR